MTINLSTVSFSTKNFAIQQNQLTFLGNIFFLEAFFWKKIQADISEVSTLHSQTWNMEDFGIDHLPWREKWPKNSMILPTTTGPWEDTVPQTSTPENHPPQFERKFRNINCSVKPSGVSSSRGPNVGGIHPINPTTADASSKGYLSSCARHLCNSNAYLGRALRPWWCLALVQPHGFVVDGLTGFLLQHRKKQEVDARNQCRRKKKNSKM